MFVFNPICGHLCVGKSKVKSISLTEHTEHAEEGGLESQKLFSHRVRRAHGEKRIGKSKAFLAADLRGFSRMLFCFIG